MYRWCRGIQLLVLRRRHAGSLVNGMRWQAGDSQQIFYVKVDYRYAGARVKLDAKCCSWGDGP